MLSHFGLVLTTMNLASFCPYAPRVISVHTELALRTPALCSNRYAAPAKLPTWLVFRNEESRGVRHA